MSAPVTITCGRCAAVAPIDQWKVWRAANVFRCPQCSWAFERRPGVNRWGDHCAYAAASEPGFRAHLSQTPCPIPDPALTP